MENSQVVVMYASYRHWILEGIVRESANAIGLKIRIIWIPVNFRELFAWSVITSFKNFLYFWKPVLIVNQKMYITLINFRATKLWLKFSTRVRIYFTHETNLENLRNKLETTNFVNRITCFNSRDAKNLREVVSDSCEVIPAFGAVDRNVFRPLSKAEGLESKFVLIAGVSNQRKNPGVIKKVIESNPDINFVIHGNGWDNCWPNSERVPANLEIIKFDFAAHPKLIREASCLLTLAILEGGPYPTLEALASGTPVVATETGWNSEVINDSNGFIVSHTFELSQIRKALIDALSLKTRVMKSDLLPQDFNWKRIGRALYL
jgi:glycosyltransferase involved in cell wall biosynthesis